MTDDNGNRCGAFDLARLRLAREDAERRAWLDRRVAEEREHMTPEDVAERRRANAAAAARFRARQKARRER